MESQKLESEFHLHAQEHVSALKRELDINLEALQFVNSFFKSSKTVTRENFRTFTKDILQRNQGLQALEWVPRIPHTQREDYERAARIEGLPDFEITELQEPGKMIRAVERDEYYPVYYVEPYKGNEIALGFDLALNPASKAAMEKSRDSGQLTATARITLVQETGRQYGFLVLLPVYQVQTPIDTVETRRKNLTGFLMGVYRVSMIVDSALKHSEGFNTYIYDMSGPGGEDFLYAYPVQTEKDSNQREHGIGLKISHQLNVADRQWQVVCEFTSDFTGYFPMAVSWGGFAGGLLFTCLLAIYIITHIKRTTQIEELAERLSTEVVERRQAGKSLQESEEKYRNILESIAEGYYEVDLAGNYTFCNNAMCQISGCAKDEFIGMNNRQFMTPATAKEIYKAFNKVYTTGKPSGSIEWETIRPDGGKRFLEISTYLMKNSEGLPVGFRGIARDVTKRQLDREEKERLEARLQQSYKMEAIGTLAGGIAHDFNNILSAIIGYSELALMKSESDSVIKDDLKEVLTAGGRAKDLVRQILAFSRQSAQEVMPIMPSLIVKETIKLLRSATPATIDVKQNIKSDSLIMGDQTRIHQIVMNLCTNAVHAMEENGGTLTVDLIDVHFDESFTSQYTDLIPGKYLKLSVSDTGKGIKPDIIASIFEPYFTTKEIGEGTGLGLSVVQGIVKELKGEITVTSEPVSGSTFTVYLPILEKQIELKPETVEILPVGKERILLVDDEVSIVNMCRQMLTGLGYTVTTRTSSIEALELFRNRPDAFDLVMTDMTMPNMTGDRLAGELMKIRPDIPVILCTGYSKKMSEESAAKLGFKAFVMKPFVRSELAKTVRKVLDERRKDER